MSENFISLGILSYNRFNYLKETIRSAVANANEPLEIIVHDDGSADPALCEWLASLVRGGGISSLILNPIGHNSGQGVALNRLFNMAGGDIIIKCDQDLLFQPGWTLAVRDTLEASAAAYHWTGEPRVGALGLFKYHVAPVHYEDMYLYTHRRDEIEWDVCKDFVGSLFAVPRDAWEEFGQFEERSRAFAEDAVFKHRVTESDEWCCALTPTDFVENIGFGVGRSTLVKGFNEKGEGVLAQIKSGPKLVTEVKG